MIVELRQYTLHPGGRDILIELFEREFFEPLEACGMTVVGTFRDLDDPNRFVWFRSFADMERRREALACFYGGPIWRAHREAANATMIDSDDVLLLRPVSEEPFPALASAPPGSPLTVMVFCFRDPAGAELVARAKEQLQVTDLLETEPATNTFPALPVREGEHAIVALSREAPAVPADWTQLLKSPPQRLRLEPTKRSRLR